MRAVQDEWAIQDEYLKLAMLTKFSCTKLPA